MGIKISSGKVPRAQKVVIYGPEGIGKTTLASCFPDPLFIDTENGSSHLDVRRIDGVTDWQTLKNAINEIVVNPLLCKTLVIDTMDQAELWATDYVLKENPDKDGRPRKSIESFGYGKGYNILGEEVARGLYCLNDVIAVGVNVVVIAHAKMRKFEQPDEAGAYDRWEMKLSKNVAPLIKEWADLILFCNYKTLVITGEDKKSRARGGKRVMYTTHHPCWDAKNRHNLPEELPMDFDEIASLFPVIKQPREQMYDLMERDNITPEQLKTVVVNRGQYGPDDPIDSYSDPFITNWIIKYWDRIIEMINADDSADQINSISKEDVSNG